MAKFNFGKLVRNGTLDDILADGNTPEYKIVADDQEFLDLLIKKLHQKINDIQLAKTSDIISELADLDEIVDAIKKTLKTDNGTFKKIKQEKSTRKGNFDKRIFIKTVVTKPGSKLENYYRQHPKDYPEI